MKPVTTINKFTGESYEYSPKSLAELINCYRDISEAIKALELAKKQLAAQVPFDGSNQTEAIRGYMFRNSAVQRMTYDKAVLRQQLDEDTLDLLLEPNKKAVDEYLKTHLEKLGPASTVIRANMVPVGKAYSVTRLEKVTVALDQ